MKEGGKERKKEEMATTGMKEEEREMETGKGRERKEGGEGNGRYGRGNNEKLKDE